MGCLTRRVSGLSDAEAGVLLVLLGSGSLHHEYTCVCVLSSFGSMAELEQKGGLKVPG